MLLCYYAIYIAFHNVLYILYTYIYIIFIYICMYYSCNTPYCYIILVELPSQTYIPYIPSPDAFLKIARQQ